LLTLQWEKLLNGERRKDQIKGQAEQTNQDVKAVDHRTELERDHDRILFSTPVRRMQDKTQVFPLEAHDSVRTRLTHSHEVANMARSFGTALVYAYSDKIPFPKDVAATRNVPALLEAIGLAHDLGNPPFGHQGEAAIQSWMNAQREKDTNFFAALTNAQKADFLKFEGNAQAFRLLTRLQIVNDDFGLNMTYAFLAALMKYPYPSASDENCPKVQARKKFNFFQSEAEIAKEVWSKTGLREDVRHPLTYIMEACDDIAYCVVDIEDAAKKGMVNFETLIWYLENAEEAGDPVVADVVKHAKARNVEYRKPSLSLSASELDDITLQMWRVKTIGVMVPSAIDAFVKYYDSIMRGSFDCELIVASVAGNLRKCLKAFAKKHIYNHRQVLEEELKGHKTIHGLMDIFWATIKDRKDADSIGSDRPPLSSYVYSRISENYRRVAESERNSMPLRYKELQLITDMISGMTDTFAISLLKDLRKRGAV
jgi:dGTPase